MFSDYESFPISNLSTSLYDQDGYQPYETEPISTSNLSDETIHYITREIVLNTLQKIEQCPLTPCVFWTSSLQIVDPNTDTTSLYPMPPTICVNNYQEKIWYFETCNQCPAQDFLLPQKLTFTDIVPKHEETLEQFLSLSTGLKFLGYSLDAVYYGIVLYQCPLPFISELSLNVLRKNDFINDLFNTHIGLLNYILPNYTIGDILENANWSMMLFCFGAFTHNAWLEPIKNNVVKVPLGVANAMLFSSMLKPEIFSAAVESTFRADISHLSQQLPDYHNFLGEGIEEISDIAFKGFLGGELIKHPAKKFISKGAKLIYLDYIHGDKQLSWDNISSQLYNVTTKAIMSTSCQRGLTKNFKTHLLDSMILPYCRAEIQTLMESR